MKKLLFTNDFHRYIDFDMSEDELIASCEYAVEMAEEDFGYDIDQLIEKNGWLVSNGYIGYWGGKTKCGHLIKNHNDLLDAMYGPRRATPVICEVYLRDDGVIEFFANHYDATNYFEIKQLSAEGMKRAENYINHCCERALGLRQINELYSSFTRKRKIVI